MSVGSPWGPPPRRSRSGGSARRLVSLVVALVVAALAFVVVRGPVWDAVEQAAGMKVPDTEDVDEPGERVAVSTELGGGLGWTMQEAPFTEEQRSPRGDGTFVTMSMWATDLDAAGEVVGTFDTAGMAFDMDAAVYGLADIYGAEASELDVAEVQGHPARTAHLEDLDFEDLPSGSDGWLTLVQTDTSVVVLMMVGRGGHDEAIRDQQRILVESLVFG